MIFLTQWSNEVVSKIYETLLSSLDVHEVAMPLFSHIDLDQRVYSKKPKSSGEEVA